MKFLYSIDNKIVNIFQSPLLLTLWMFALSQAGAAQQRPLAIWRRGAPAGYPAKRTSGRGAGQQPNDLRQFQARLIGNIREGPD